MRIGLVGKYTDLKDAYKSLSEALVHGGIANRVGVEIVWLEASRFSADSADSLPAGLDGILVPGALASVALRIKLPPFSSPASNRSPFSASAMGCKWQ